jgi:hypothetical protein
VVREVLYFTCIGESRCCQEQKLKVKIRTNIKYVRLEFLTAVSTKMAVFCVVAPCSLV